MGKILVIAEKPSVAKDYAMALKQNTLNNGYYEGDKYVITWSFGHIVSRKELYEYDSNINRRYENKEHILNVIPYFPTEHTLKLSLINTEFITNKDKLSFAKNNNTKIKEREKVLNYLFSRNDIDFIINGCDAGREGEAIFCQIYDYFKCTFPVKRLWLSSNTAADIQNGFKNLKDGSEYSNLRAASYARAENDWEHGLNLSVLFSSLYSAPLSVGRVMTPVLNLITEREKEIDNFKAEDYFLLDGNFSTLDNFKYKGKLVIDNKLGDIVSDGKIKDVGFINKIISEVQQKQGKIKSIDKKLNTEYPKTLFSITELQKEMNKKYKFTAQQTLSIAQSLYETHKITTYPRTNSEYLNTSMRDEAFKRLNELPSDFDNFVNIAKEKKCFYEKILNDKEVEDHYGIIPTSNARNYDLSKLSEMEKKVFFAIVKRFLCLFLPNHEYESTVLLTEVGNYTFKTTGKKIVNQGWRMVYSSEPEDTDEKAKDENNQDLTHAFTEGMPILCDNAVKVAKKTQPPRRYTEATLLNAMELGGSKNVNIEDQEKLKALKSKGLGTGATRAGIIEKIIGLSYVTREKGGTLSPSAMGRDFMEKIKVDMLKSPEMTGELEYNLNLVEKGQMSKDEFTKKSRQFVRLCVEKTKESYTAGDVISGVGTPNTDCTCPACNMPVKKSDKYFYCSNRSNGCTFIIPRVIGGQNFEESDLKDICDKKPTRVFKGLKSSKKNANGTYSKYDASFSYDTQTMKIVTNFSNTPKDKHETRFICPVCHSPIFEYEKHYGCSSYGKGCSFSVFKQLGGKTLTEDFLTDFFKIGESNVLKGLVNPKYPSKVYNIRLTIKNGITDIIYVDNDGNDIIIQSVETDHKCPLCKKTILDKGDYLQCSNAKCKLTIGKSFSQVKLSEQDIADLMTKKETEIIEFKKKDGSGTYKAKLYIDKKLKKVQPMFIKAHKK